MRAPPCGGARTFQEPNAKPAGINVFCRRFYFDVRKQTAKLNAVLQGLEFIIFAAEIIDDFGKRAHGFPVADAVVQEQDNVIFFSG